MFKPILIATLLFGPVNVPGLDMTTCGCGLFCRQTFNRPHDQDNRKTHDGKVVSVDDGKLVMTDKDGKNQHQHQVTGAARILVDGMAARLMDLKAGDVVKVTISTEGEVMLIEATRKSV